MDKIKLLIVDSDKRFAEMTSHFMMNYADIEVIGCEENGQEALRTIRSSRPDAVLFDAVLPGLDGISLLRQVNEMRSHPAMICCTRFYSDIAMEAMRTFGAAYLLFKPIELQTLHPLIVSCAQLNHKFQADNRALDDGLEHKEERRTWIRNFLVSMGIPSKLIGCTYLVEAIRLAQDDPSLTRNLSKGLYLEIAHSMNSTSTRIERCIRNAISVGFQCGGLDDRLPGCPSNKEFINYALRTFGSGL